MTNRSAFVHTLWHKYFARTVCDTARVLVFKHVLRAVLENLLCNGVFLRPVFFMVFRCLEKLHAANPGGGGVLIYVLQYNSSLRHHARG